MNMQKIKQLIDEAFEREKKAKAKVTRQHFASVFCASYDAVQTRLNKMGLCGKL